MPPDPKSSKVADKFLAVACDRTLLTAEDAQTLDKFAKTNLVGASSAALQTGMLLPVQVEMIEALSKPDDLAPGYEVSDVLGHGALGIVYRAYQLRLKRDVAIKSIIESRVTTQDVISRFEQEGTTIGRLKHPNIVRAYDFGCHNDRLYLVMELVEGQDLRKQLESGPLDTQTSLWILRQTALGLAHAKAHDIIHQDIKPGNLILTQAPAGFDLPKGVPLVKIADFGLAKLNAAEDTEAKTPSRTMVGTPMYIAPEQLTGKPVDHRADIYALGATLFQMLSGKPPYDAEKLSDIFATKVKATPPQLDHLPDDVGPELVELILDLMQHDPDDRPTDYDELVKRIDKLLKTGSGIFLNPIFARSQPSANNQEQQPRLSRVRSWITRHANGVRMASILLLVATLSLLILNPPRILSVSATPTLSPDGWEEALFDGRTLSGFQSPDGLWLATIDSEGGSVLTGEGSISRPLPVPPIPDQQTGFGFGCRVGIDLLSADQCELHFGYSGPSLQDCARYIVRYNRNSVSLGKCDGREGTYVPISREIPIPENKNNAPAYDQISIELHKAQWFVFFNGELLGDAAVADDGKNRILEFMTRGGKVNFEAPSIYRLSKATESSG